MSKIESEALIELCPIYQHIRGYFYNEMRYVNLRFIYLLTYLLTYQGCRALTYAFARLSCWSMCPGP